MNTSIPLNSISPREFAKRNGIGLTKTYEEINSGRLVAYKCGSRTIITIADELAWIQKLPRIAPKDGAAVVNQTEVPDDNTQNPKNERVRANPRPPSARAARGRL